MNQSASNTLVISRLLLLMSLPTLIIGACATATTTHEGRVAAMQEPAQDRVPGVPNRPDAVTVVPFQLTPAGHILLNASVDGRHGTFLLDTGDPVIHLSRRYVKPGANGGLDTVTSRAPASFRAPTVVHTLDIGTFHQRLDTTDVGPPMPFVPTNGLVEMYYKLDWFRQYPVLGLLGLSGIEPFETIIDYTHKRLILIRLNSTGRRVVDVPAYKAAMKIPLLPISASRQDSHQYWWGIQGLLNNSQDTLEIDTGYPYNAISEVKHPDVATQVNYDLVVQGRTFKISLSRDSDTSDDIGYPFLSQQGVVGFNLRTREFILYH